MYKTIEMTRSEFSSEKLKDLKANDCIIVSCSSRVECDSVRSLAYQFKNRYPNILKDNGVSKYVTSIVGDNGVRITAIF